MTEFVVHGDELKKIVRIGRRRPLPFAFCPSVGDDESLFATHRKKPPKFIARRTREESGQTKVAYGTFIIIGKTMVLTCIKELPAIAKKLKKHMRAERLPLNIRVMDMSGREIEADIDDTDDGEDIFGPDDDDEDEDDGDGFVRWNAAKDHAAPLKDRLAQRVSELKPPILAVGGERGERLRDLLAAVIDAQENGRREKAETLVARLEQEVRGLMNSANRPQFAKQSPAAPKPRPDHAQAANDEEDEDEDDDEDGDDEPRKGRKEPDKDTADDGGAVLRLARRVATLRRRIGTIEGDAGVRLMAALALVAQALRAGEAEVAEDSLAKIEPAVARAERQAGQASA